MIREFLKSILPAPALKFIAKNISVPLRDIMLPVRIKLHLPLRRMRKKISFEIHISEHCNLNCYGCDHFSPLADPEFVNLEVFRRDMARMGEIFSHTCGIISLLGGEPLLNPQITELMKITRDNFSNGNIHIITNGILLTQQDDAFWKSCHDNNVKIKITRYPIKLDFDKIKSIADKFGVDCQYYSVEGKDIFIKKKIDLSGSSNMDMNFGKCNRNGCTTLEHGRLYVCSFVPHVHIFNKRFHKEIPITEDDYIDIYQNVTAGDILRKLTRSIPACRYCDIPGNENINWQVSKREISEWV